MTLPCTEQMLFAPAAAAGSWLPHFCTSREAAALVNVLIPPSRCEQLDLGTRSWKPCCVLALEPLGLTITRADLLPEHSLVFLSLTLWAGQTCLYWINSSCSDGSPIKRCSDVSPGETAAASPPSLALPWCCSLAHSGELTLGASPAWTHPELQCAGSAAVLHGHPAASPLLPSSSWAVLYTKNMDKHPQSSPFSLAIEPSERVGHAQGAR